MGGCLLLGSIIRRVYRLRRNCDIKGPKKSSFDYSWYNDFVLEVHDGGSAGDAFADEGVVCIPNV
jgi:hypothetical protein